MPGKAQLWQILTVFLQYSFLALLYYFIYQVLHAIRQDRWGQPQPVLPVQVAYLQVTSAKAGAGLTVGQQFPLKENLIIGRSSHNDIIISDTFVSAEHACIARYQNDFSLTDLGSTNGTFLNGQRISAESGLTEGDSIQIGPVTFEVKR
ncbi:MAG TPA: FHA domain-containing protein [Patescibacteria group bacterium]|nr:FHA domain-containing protein [Patescibacteria group bacterium]